MMGSSSSISLPKPCLCFGGEKSTSPYSYKQMGEKLSPCEDIDDDDKSGFRDSNSVLDEEK